MRNSTSANRRDCDGHHTPSIGKSGTAIASARLAHGAGMAVRRVPEIMGECSSASRRSASLRPRAAGLTVLTPTPRSPLGRLSAIGRVFDTDRTSPMRGAARGCGRAAGDAA